MATGTEGTIPTKQDANQVFTMSGLSGTLGATYGTAIPTPVTVTADGKLRVESGASVSVGTIERVNTIGTLELGTVGITMGDIPGGTLDVLSALPDLPGGTIDAVTSVGGTVDINIAASDVSIGGGTQYETGGTTPGTATGNAIVFDNNGTINMVADDNGFPVTLATKLDSTNDSVAIGKGTVTLVSALATGSIAVTAGTMVVTSLPDLPGGTVDAISALPDLPGGTVDVVSSVANLAGGTVQINPKPSRSIITYGTAIGGTAATGVTLIGAPGSGTSIYLNDISLINRGTGAVQAYIGFGTASTAGTSQVVAGNLAANGGIQKSYPKAVGGHITNLALLGSITAAGTVDVNLSYWVQ